jgi:hypothetical protein
LSLFPEIFHILDIRPLPEYSIHIEEFQIPILFIRIQDYITSMFSHSIVKKSLFLLQKGVSRAMTPHGSALPTKMRYPQSNYPKTSSCGSCKPGRQVRARGYALQFSFYVLLGILTVDIPYLHTKFQRIEEIMDLTRMMS